MKTKELTLDLALEAFWTKVAERHPERETGNFPSAQAYDLEKYARNAVDSWLEINKPVFYVQRTVTLVVKITEAESPEDAEAMAAGLADPDWFTDSLDTNNEYLVLDKNGKCYL